MDNLDLEPPAQHKESNGAYTEDTTNNIKIHSRTQDKLIFNHFKNHNQKQSDNFCIFRDLEQLVKNPESESKPDASCILPCLSTAKTKSKVLEHDLMTMCVTDIDTGNNNLEEVKNKLADICINQYIIYSTASSMRLSKDKQTINGKRWRVCIPLDQALDCATWLILQEALSNLLSGDHCVVNVNQIAYAPNNPPVNDPREIRHYEYYIKGGE